MTTRRPDLHRTETPDIRARISLIEHDFWAIEGHQANHIEALLAAARRLRVSARVEVPRDVPPEVRRWLDSLGADGAASLLTGLAQRSPVRVLNWLLASVALPIDLARLARRDGGPTTLFLPTGIVEVALGAWLGALLLPADIRVATQFMWWQRRESPALRHLPVRALRRLTEAALAQYVPPNLLLAADTPELADDISRRIGRPVVALPMPMDWDRYAPPRVHGRTHPVFAFLGGARAEKGIEHALRAALRLPADVRLLLQVTLPKRGAGEGIEALVEAVAERPNVELVRTPPSTAEYAALLDRSDVLLLPYDPSAYGHRSSGIHVEALGCGKAILAPAATLIGSTIGPLAMGLAYDSWTADALHDAILAYRARWADDEPEAVRRAEAYRVDVSADAVVRALIERTTTA